MKGKSRQAMGCTNESVKKEGRSSSQGGKDGVTTRSHMSLFHQRSGGGGGP